MEAHSARAEAWVHWQPAPARGGEAAVALWQRMIRLYDGSPRTRHLVAAPVIDVEGDSAVCRSSFEVSEIYKG